MKVINMFIQTKKIEVDDFNPDISKLIEAAEKIKDDSTVVFPTETVYGLGANAISKNAVQKIFAAQGRPSDNPLIVHVSCIDGFKRYAHISDQLLYMVSEFVPGPITFVLEKRDIIPDIVTASRQNVGIRFPAHPVAQKFIELSGFPIAAPSANISGRPSPTNAEDVIEDMNGKVDYIITSGNLKFGIESTVVDVTGNTPVILRPGPIPPEKIEEVFGKVIIPDFVYGQSTVDVALAPGMKYRHYSPCVPVVLFEYKQKIDLLQISDNLSFYENPIFLFLKEHADIFESIGYDKQCIGTINNLYEIGAKIFSMFRKYEKSHDAIIIEGVPDKAIGIAIMNRLRKAASKIIG